MQYFYIKTENLEGHEKASIGGMYRHDIILSLLPTETPTLLIKQPTGLVKQALRRRNLVKIYGESDLVIENREKGLTTTKTNYKRSICLLLGLIKSW